MQLYIIEMVLSEYAKIRMLIMWREGYGPTSIVKMLDAESIKITQESVTCFIARYIILCMCMICQQTFGCFKIPSDHIHVGRATV